MKKIDKDLTRRKIWHKDEIRLLIKAIQALNKEEDIKNLLRDLLTPQEIRILSRRLKIASLLNKDYSFREIIFQLDDVGVNTITKVHEKLNTGTGYKEVLSRII